MDRNIFFSSAVALAFIFLPGCDTVEADTGDQEAVEAVAALQTDYEAALSYAVERNPQGMDEATLVATSLTFYSDLHGSRSDEYRSFESGILHMQSRNQVRTAAAVSDELRAIEARVGGPL